MPVPAAAPARRKRASPNGRADARALLRRYSGAVGAVQNMSRQQHFGERMKFDDPWGLIGTEAVR
jgi:hypothetical protein